MSRRFGLVAVGVLLTLPFALWAAPAPVEESPTLRERLYALDELRKGPNTSVEEVEKQGEKLLAKYKNAEDQAKIYFHIAHVFAQSDIRVHSERVTKYVRLALVAERDPIQRATLHSYLGSAAEVAGGDLKFEETRRMATLAYLAGYKEILTLKLPAVAPELPGIDKYDVDSNDPKEIQALRRQHAAQVKAREEAEFTRAMVQHRDVLLSQVLEL